MAPLSGRPACKRNTLERLSRFNRVVRKAIFLRFYIASHYRQMDTKWNACAPFCVLGGFRRVPVSCLYVGLATTWAHLYFTALLFEPTHEFWFNIIINIQQQALYIEAFGAFVCENGVCRSDVRFSRTRRTLS